MDSVGHKWKALTMVAGIFFGAAGFSAANAQQGHWALYGADEGLSQQTPQTFFQDSDGYLWVGTRAGLNRFDGARFTSFGIRHGLQNDWINDISQDDAGDIWVATNNGLSIWSAELGFRNFNIDDGLPDKMILALEPDASGGMWVGTPSGLVHWNGAEWRRFGSAHGLDEPSIFVIRAVPGKGLYVGTASGLFYGIDGSFRRVGKETLTSVFGLDVDSQGTAWVADGLGVYSFRDGVLQSEDAAPAFQAPFNLVACQDGSLWIRHANGASLFRDGKFELISGDQGMPIHTVVDVFQDREGILWVGGIGGMAKFIGRPFTNYTMADGLGSNTVWEMTRDVRGDLWVGTTGGASRLSNGDWDTFTVADGLAGDFIRTIHARQDGSVWIGSTGGLTRYQNGRFEVVPEFTPLGEVYWIAEDTSGRLWFSTRASGLWRETSGPQEAFAVERITVPEQRFTNARMLAASDGRVWVSGDNGLSVWNGSVWHTFTTNDGMAANEPYFLAEDQAGNIWFGYHSSRGVTRFDGHQFTTLTSADGLSNDAVYTVGADQIGNVWIGTASGLDRYDGTRFVSYGTSDGYVGSESNAGALLAEEDGTIWFGAIGGLSHYNPAWDLSYGQPPVVRIGALEFDGQPWSEHQTVPFNRNNLAGEFHILSNVNREQLQTRYRLVPSASLPLPSFFQSVPTERPWLSLKGTAFGFNNLGAASYSLEIQARKYGGEWSETTTAHFKIAPPYWQRWWFLLMAAVAVAAAARVLIALKLRRVRAKNAWLQRHIAQLEEADRVKNEFLSNMSHEIRTPVAGILGFAAILREEVEGPLLEFVDYISASATRLQRTLESVLDLAQLANDRLGIDVAPMAIGPEVAAAVETMRPAAEKKSLTISFHDLSGGARALSHEGHLGRVLDILIFNAIKFTDSGGVQVFLHARPDSMQIDVVDTGIGIAPDFLPELFQPFKQASRGSSRTHEGNGLGLSITKKLIELMGGSVLATSVLGHGSQFSVCLPRERAETPSPTERTASSHGPRRLDTGRRRAERVSHRRAHP